MRLFAYFSLLIYFVIFIAGGASRLQAQSAVRETKEPRIAATDTLQPSLVRRTTRRETHRTGYGGTLTLNGAPTGSITVEAWARPEVEITADIELRADTEEELSQLAEVVNFTLDRDASRLRLYTFGTHDRKYMRRVAKNFPKKLLSLPWRIDYTVRVPTVTDMEINAGRGALAVTNTEGALRFNLTEGNVSLTLAGGDVVGTIGRGVVLLRPTKRSWRGRGVELRLANGDLNAELPAGFNADFDARVLQTGAIENSFDTPTPFEITDPNAPPASTRTLRGRFGAGGAAFTLTVGNGSLRLQQAQSSQ